MALRVAEPCAYCGKPLQLVAGFCVFCHAPASVAQRAKLVAAARRNTGVLLAEQHTPGSLTLMAAPTLAQRPTPTWARVVLLLSLVSLVLASFFIMLHLNGNTLSLPFLPANSSLSASTSANGAATTAFVVGQPLYLDYAVAVGRPGATIQLRVAVDHATPRWLTEHWPHGNEQRAMSLVALAPGIWHIALLSDGQVIRSLTVTIAPAAGS